MNSDSNRKVRIIGVPLDLGASRRGTDVGPSALRLDEGNISAERTMELLLSAMGKSIL